MAIVWGRVLWGQVEREPGKCYVSTEFFHVYYFPLVPLRGYVVVDGSEDFPEFEGIPIPLNSKSVWVGYARGWTALVSAFATSGIAFAWTKYWNSDLRSGKAFLCFVASTLVFGGINYFILKTESRWYLAALALSIIATICWWTMVGRYLPAFLVANGCMIAYSFTRRYTYRQFAPHEPSQSCEESPP